ncbi:MAG: tetrahydrofolate dehydrogenase/cyclohydrolase catalytic domain-containing protein [Patescibacteria group bacterium]
MLNKILDGKKLSEKFLRKIKKQITKLDALPGLAAILVGDDPASTLYVRLKKEACEKCGVHFHRYFFDENCHEEEIIKSIDFLNQDPETHGILVQLPLPKKFNTEKIISSIDYRKDIDGFHPRNQANMKKCVYKVMPPLPMGIIELVNSTKIKIENKNIVILCNHKIFSQPFICVWGEKNKITTVTLKDNDWKQHVEQADLLIVCVGQANLITNDLIKKDVIIIDVGINKVKGKLVGDVDLKSVLEKVSFISPVPGGVGPMTIAMLLQNLVKIKSFLK